MGVVIQEYHDMGSQRQQQNRLLRVIDQVIAACERQGYDRGAVTLRLHRCWVREVDGRLVPIVPV